MAQENVDLQNGGAENGSSKAVIFSSLKPQLCVPAPKAADAVQFYKTAFGAEELKRSVHPKRKAEQELPLILSAELKLSPSVFIVCDITDENFRRNDGTGVAFCLETDDVNVTIKKCWEFVVNAGVEVEAEPAEDEGACCDVRVGKVKDPFRYIQAICTPTKKDTVDVDA
ncbi:uncharacterized protein At5g48480-like [Magnolia sinica]|uniref:uncharacterized protein At5g48480-like n=1 Tax=Magnolia sinica TaxID=86752 RepID=UPI002658BA6A|nr:uncharacterized protein At5g48480-like [Magnolia sinica]